MKKSLILFVQIASLTIVLAITGGCRNTAYNIAATKAIAGTAVIDQGVKIAKTKYNAYWTKSGNTDYKICRHLQDSDYVFIATEIMSMNPGMRVSWSNTHTGNVFHAIPHEQYNPKFKKSGNSHNSYNDTSAICRDVSISIEREELIEDVITLCKNNFNKWVMR